MNVDIKAAVENLREERLAEAEEAVAVRLQSLIRCRQAMQRTKALREEFLQRFRDMTLAATKLQSRWRGKKGRERAARIAHLRAVRIAFENKMATRIQTRIRGKLGRRRAKDRKRELEEIRRQRNHMATQLQKTWRGKMGREAYKRRQEEFKLETAAAIKLQKVWRGSKVPGWRDIRFGQIKIKVAGQSEENARLAKVKRAQFLKERAERMNRDSASEEEEEEDPDDDWRNVWDDSKEIWVWFSPSRAEKVEGTRPDRKWFEKSLVNMYCRVFWPMENKWFQGFFSRFNKIKMKHRVQYDDGDHEWVNVKEEIDRIQVYQPDVEAWAMLRVVWPKSTKSKEEIEAEREAERSRPDWEERWDEVNGRPWFFNKRTGENQTEKPWELVEYEERKQKIMKRKFEEMTLSAEELFQIRLKDWTEYFDDDNYAPYWYNNETGETSWINPANMPIVSVLK